MLIIKIWNFLRGYVIIRVEGLSLEKFINYAISRGIYFWDIYRIDYTTLHAKVGIEGYKELRHIVKKSGCKVKINTKMGYPFFMHKIKARKMLMAGFILALLAVGLVTSFIWEIEVIGTQNIPKEVIEKKLENLGLNTGVLKYKLNIADIENTMMITVEDLAWIGIEIKGTKVIVEVVEKVKPPEKISKEIPCDIIAVKKGVIEKVIARTGDALIQKGDIVKDGQLLISGTIMREGVEPRYVHSLGEVYARTYYEAIDEMSLVKITKIKTGEKHTRRMIKIGNSQLTLGSEEIPFNSYIVETRNKNLSKWRNIKIPVEIIIEDYFEAIEKKEILPKETVKKALLEKIRVNLVSKLPENIEILNQDIKYNEENNIMKAKLIIEALEQIGAQAKLNLPQY